MTKTKKALLIGVPVLIGGYLIYRQFRGKKTYQQAVIETPPGTPESTPDSGCVSYKVTTLATPLNVRDTPSTSGNKIGSLAKGTIVSAKASSTSGWMQLCEQTGYASADYLTKQ
jgi:uncharacterized protein YgiM (DUF1202 family)